MRSPWSFLGFVQVVALGVTMVLAGATLLTALPAVIRVMPLWYGVSLAMLILLAPLTQPSGFVSPKSYLRFSSGGRFGFLFMLGVCALLLPFSPRISSQFQTLDISLLLLNLGSFWLPSIPAMGAYGFSLVSSQDTGSKITMANSFTFEGISRLVLGMYSRSGEVLRKSWLEILILVPFMSFYARGWVAMSSIGADLSPETGLLIAIGIILSGVVSLRKLVTGQDMNAIPNLVVQSTPSVRKPGSGEIIIALILVFLIVTSMWLM
jgi:hypothetical protein